MDMDVFLHYPGLRANHADDKVTGYEGIIFVNEKSFPVKLTKYAKGWRMSGSDDIIKQLNSQHIQQPAKYLHVYCAHLATLHPAHEPIPVAKYRRVLQEYREFGNFYISLEDRQLANDLSKISVTYVDEKLRKHCMTINVSFDSRQLFSIGDYDLPIELKAEHHSLIELFEIYTHNVNALQEFFDVMDVLDRFCWVLEPQIPMRRDLWRRIIFDHDLSFVINVDPKYPTDLPNVKFYGPPERVLQVESVLKVNFELWNQEGDFFDELLQFLDIAVFPPRGAFDINLN